MKYKVFKRKGETVEIGEFDDWSSGQDAFVEARESGDFNRVEFNSYPGDGRYVNQATWNKTDKPALDTVAAESFKQELKALLEKYNVCIGFSCGEGSDTHGLHDERIVITDPADNEIVSVDGWCLQARDMQ